MSEAKWTFSEPCVMPVRAGTIGDADKARLSEIGVVVVECEDPDSLRMIRPDSMVSGKGMLYAALKGLMLSNSSKQAFAEEIYRQVCAAYAREDAKP